MFNECIYEKVTDLCSSEVDVTDSLKYARGIDQNPRMYTVYVYVYYTEHIANTIWPLPNANLSYILSSRCKPYNPVHNIINEF
jgi:hypothetical protein